MKAKSRWSKINEDKLREAYELIFDAGYNYACTKVRPLKDGKKYMFKPLLVGEGWGDGYEQGKREQALYYETRLKDLEEKTRRETYTELKKAMEMEELYYNCPETPFFNVWCRLYLVVKELSEE